MAKINSPHGTQHVIADALALVGSFVQLGTTLLSHKIQSSAGTANAYVQKNVNVDEIESRLSGAAIGIEQASNYALHTDLKQMAEDVAQFARKHPVASLAAGIVLGTLVARLAQPREDNGNPGKVPVKAQAVRTKGKKSRKTRSQANGATATHGKVAPA
jgi:hypothetical protein